MALDARKDEEVYEKFYRELGDKYPEAKLQYETREGIRRKIIILKHLESFAKTGKNLLDVGCSEGTYTIPYCKMGGKAHGIDISGTLIEKAKEKAKKEGLRDIFFTVEDVQKFEGSEETYDIILMAEVLEHLNQPEKALINLVRVLKKGGYLLLTTPTPLPEGAKLNLKYILDILYGKKLVYEHTRDSRHHSSANYGVSPVKYRHDGYYPIPLVRYIEKYGFSCNFFYTIGGSKSIIRGFLMRASPRVLRLFKPISLFGIINIQMFRKISNI